MKCYKQHGGCSDSTLSPLPLCCYTTSTTTIREILHNRSLFTSQLNGYYLFQLSHDPNGSASPLMGSRQASGLRAGSRTSIPGKRSFLNYVDKMLYIIDHHLDIENFFTFKRKNQHFQCDLPRLVNVVKERPLRILGQYIFHPYNKFHGKAYLSQSFIF